MAGFEPVRPDILIGGKRFSKQRITLGDKHFDIYNTGAHHSDGDLIIHQVEDGIVWISDLAFNQRVTFMADGHSKDAIEAQDWLLATFPTVRLMVPGHGSAQTPPFPMVTGTRAYMHHLRDAMGKAVEEDIELQDAVDRTAFRAWQNMPMYDLNHRKNLNFVYREMEAELF